MGVCEISGQSDVRVLARGVPAHASPLPPLPGLGLIIDPDGVTSTVQVENCSRVRAQGRVSLSGSRVTAHLLDTGLMLLLWDHPSGLSLHLTLTSPFLSAPCRQSQVLSSCPGSWVFLLLLHP